MTRERVQKILARAGITSRRKAKEMLREGRITVNGAVAEIGSKVDPEKDAIKIDGRRVQPHRGEYRYLLLNKPRGVLTTVSDPEGRPTVMDLVPRAYRKALVPVGRLDFNSEGLILLTDDGEFAQRVAHPRYGGTKTYEVKVKGCPDEAQIERLSNGVFIEGRRTAPAKITPREMRKSSTRRQSGFKTADKPEVLNTWWVIELTEGRTRQIREMFFRTGHPVQRLRRVGIGPLRDRRLPLGAVRELTPDEVKQFQQEPVQRTSKPIPRRAVRPGAEAKPRRAEPGQSSGEAATRRQGAEKARHGKRSTP